MKRTVTRNQAEVGMLTDDRLMPILNTAMREMFERLGTSFGGARDLYKSCGYDKVTSPQMFWDAYKREELARAVIDIPVDKTWKAMPVIREDTDDDTPVKGGLTPKSTEFEKAVEKLFDSPKLNIQRKLANLDRMSRIGRYGVMILGFNDANAKRPEQAVKKAAGLKVLYMRAFPQNMVKIDSYNTDPTSPQYGFPKTYRITMFDGDVMEDFADNATVVSPYDFRKEKIFHASRVIHFASDGGCATSDIFGLPALNIVWNRLHDCWKILGGAAESLWQTGFPTVMFNADPQATIGKDEIKGLKDNIRKMFMGLERSIVTKGMTTSVMSGTSASIGEAYSIDLDMICMITRIPKRILLGATPSAAGNDDTTEWNEYIKTRKEQTGTALVNLFIGRMIELGIIPTPAGGEESFCVEWEDMDNLTVDQATKRGAAMADAFVKYIQGGVDRVITPEDFFRVLGFPAWQARQFRKNVTTYLDSEEFTTLKAIKEDEMALEMELKAKAVSGTVDPAQMKGARKPASTPQQRAGDTMVAKRTGTR